MTKIEYVAKKSQKSLKIKKKHLAKEFFGLLSGWERPTDKIKEEMKKGW